MFRLKLVSMAALVLGVAALAGCNRDGRSDDQRTATGQVLQGSISDSMIPYEQLQSRPPLAPRVAEKAGKAAESADSGGEADSAAPDEAAAPAAPATPATPINY